jgi:2',3'-cyclic-nucleotide 2'-phosphodiesterase (5'-nucleotidase family)
VLPITRVTSGALLAVAIAIFVAAASHSAARRSSDVELLVLSTASDRGELDPCGCAKNNKGGLARRATFIDSLRTANGGALLLDGGDYAHPTLTTDDRVNAFILGVMGELNYDAMTLGELELYRGVEYVQSITKSSKTPIVLANVKYSATGKPVGQRFLVREVKGVSYGIIGILGQDFGDGNEKFKELGFTVEDPFQAAQKLVPEVRKQADLVVVLAHLGSSDAQRLPKAVRGIDLVILGHYPGSVAASRVEDAVAVRPGQRGEYVGETKLVVNPENKIVSFTGDAVALSVKTIQEEPRIAAEIKALKEKLPPEASPGKESQESSSPESRDPGGNQQTAEPLPGGAAGGR